MQKVISIFVISGLLSLLSAIGAAGYPQVLVAGDFLLRGVLASFAWLGATSLVLGYGCRLLDSALDSALHGKNEPIQPPDFDPGPALSSFVKWSLCLLAGPAFLFYEALRFWILCGDMTIMDWFILVELTTPALGYWLLCVVAMNSRPDLILPLPWQVLKSVLRLGWRAVPAVIALTAAAGIHLWLGVNALLLLDTSWVVGLVLLWICWFSVWQCGTLAAQTLGAWHVRARQIQAQPPSISSAG